MYYTKGPTDDLSNANSVPITAIVYVAGVRVVLWRDWAVVPREFGTAGRVLSGTYCPVGGTQPCLFGLSLVPVGTRHCQVC